MRDHRDEVARITLAGREGSALRHRRGHHRQQAGRDGRGLDDAGLAAERHDALG